MFTKTFSQESTASFLTIKIMKIMLVSTMIMVMSTMMMMKMTQKMFLMLVNIADYYGDVNNDD